ncbi:mitochondrial carrier domain-containing protein [Collybia nuda]|uniref:Mitochondrial carrier domain-containing protein n=1 Tax=Collybia nuda TaxID=64659 RepID=A0A9P5XY36_9AGAR|nr:mitochondrial carrier domain-containing protein [Collybia nuda]
MHSDEAAHIRVSGNGSDDQPLFSAEGALKNIAFGSFAGMVSEIFEYPFDLAKVRLQSQMLSSMSTTQLRFNGPMDCLKQTWREEGIRGLYRGLPVPIIGSMAETAALFVAYSSFQNVIRAYSPGGRDTDENGHPIPLSIPQLAAAAAGAGFATSFILTPIELVKCKMQVQMMNMPPPPAHAYRRSVSAIIPPIRHTTNAAFTMASTTARPPGALAIVRSTIQNYGFRGLWLGHTGTLLRETGGTAAWFSVKELIAVTLRNRRMKASESPSRYGAGTTELLPWESAFAGAISGGACVLAFYPADTVKSAMQTEDELRAPRSVSSPPVSQKPLSRSFAGTFMRMYSAYGLRGLYAGCGMTVARAVPSSGIVFVVYDGLSAWLG